MKAIPEYLLDEAENARAFGEDELGRVNRLLAITETEFTMSAHALQAVLLDAMLVANGMAELASGACRTAARELRAAIEIRKSQIENP